MANAAALDTTIAVVTPENIAFQYHLAGPFRRLPAFLIDLATQAAILFMLMIVLLLATAFNPGLLGPFFSAILLVAFFLISWFYGAVMETYFNGRTIGKWACGVRVIGTGGEPITGKRAVIRNLLTVADLAPVAALGEMAEGVPPIFVLPTGLVGLVVMISTTRMQRLGDVAASTMVIIDERSWQLPIGKVDDPRVPALASFFPADYRISRSMARTLATYAERRDYLTPERRREVARHLSEPLIERFGFRQDIDPDLLMYALYYKTFLADASQPEPNLGPLQGYSPLLRDQHKLPGVASA
jgi:uncharacterized RDD family membrane protein YckC